MQGRSFGRVVPVAAWAQAGGPLRAWLGASLLPLRFSVIQFLFIWGDGCRTESGRAYRPFVLLILLSVFIGVHRWFHFFCAQSRSCHGAGPSPLVFSVAAPQVFSLGHRVAIGIGTLWNPRRRQGGTRPWRLVGQAGHVAVLFVVAVMPGLRPLVASFVAPFIAAPFVSRDDATHGKAKQGDGRGEKNEAGFHVGLLGGRAVA
jgi:hypothetical protein